MTKTVAGNGIDVPFGPGFPYGAGSCLQRIKKRKKNYQYKLLTRVNCSCFVLIAIRHV